MRLARSLSVPILIAFLALVPAAEDIAPPPRPVLPKAPPPRVAPPPNEASYYSVSTIPLPTNCVLEVGGLAFRPDGKLLACTRRGDVWLIHNPTSDNLADVKFTKFATGLHEALGLYVQDNNTLFVVQRPELTKLVDKDGDDVADEFVTVCDKWGVSGDYHEFAFGPARDKDGNFFVTLNVGFGGGHQAKAPWRGWCVKVSPNGKLTRSPTACARPTASTSRRTATCSTATTRASGSRRTRCTTSRPASSTATRPGCAG